MARPSTLRALELACDAFAPAASAATTATAPPILLLHGLFGSKRNNRSVGRALAQRLQTSVYNLDLRNHGESPHSSVHTYSAMAHDVARFLRSNRLPPAHVIGHSMGGKVALSLSLQSPELVRSCISVDNAPLRKPLSDEFHEYIRGMQAVSDAEVSTIHGMQDALRPFCPQKPVADFLLANFVKQNGVYRCRLPLGILAQALDSVAGFDFEAAHADYRGPTLLIRAAKSPFISDSAIEESRQLFPNLECIAVDSGHWVVSERPYEFMDIVSRWFAKH